MTKIKTIFLVFLFTFFYLNNSFSQNDYFDEGQKFYKQIKFSKSKFKFQQDIVFNPKSEKSYLYLAKIYKEEKNDQLEEQSLNTVILLNPKNEEAILLLALLKIKKSDYKETEKLIDTFKKICVSLCGKNEELNKKLKALEKKK